MNLRLYPRAERLRMREILGKARAIMEDPAKWTQGYEATNKDGQDVPCNSPDAVIFCAVGAVCHIEQIRGTSYLNSLAEVLRRLDVHSNTLFPNAGSVVAVNDAEYHHDADGAFIEEKDLSRRQVVQVYTAAIDELDEFNNAEAEMICAEKEEVAA